jgi:hypothetical protein
MIAYAFTKHPNCKCLTPFLTSPAIWTLCIPFCLPGGHNVALEIQATLPINAQHKSTVPRMEKGVHVTFVVTALAYFLVAIVGFYAFGTGVADNVLLTFSHGPTSWVVAMAGGCDMSV